MLVLTRRIGEKIVIGDDVFIQILGMNATQVKLGITAPDSTKVHREEIYIKVLSERLERAEKMAPGEGFEPPTS